MSGHGDGELIATRSGRLIASIHRHRKWLFPVVLLAVLGLATFARTLRVDNSLRIWFLEDDPALASWDKFKEQFGNDELTAIAASDPVSVYSPAALARIREATARIEAHPDVRRVTSLTNGRSIDGDGVEIRIEPLLEDGPIDAAAAAEVKRRVQANPIFRGTVVSDDDTMTLIGVELEALDDIDAKRPGILRDLRQIAADTLQIEGGTTHFGGMGVVYEGINEASLRDSAVLSGLSYLVILVGLYVFFRRVIWVVLGFGLVTIATIGTLGVAGLTGRDLNMVTAVLPTFLMTIGILDLVHFVESYDEMAAGRRPTRNLIAASLGTVLLACLFNSVTDIAGFLGLASAQMSAIRDFGLLASAGLAILFVCTVIFVVVGLSRYGGGKLRPAAAATAPSRLNAVASALYRLSVRRRRTVLASAAGLFAISLVGIALLDVDTYTIGFLADDSPVRRDHDRIERQFGHFVPYEFVVKTSAPGGVKQPDVLRRIERAERSFEHTPGVDRTTGMPEIVSRLNQVIMDGDKAEHRIPDTAEAVAQELLLWEGDEDSEPETLVDNDYRITRVTARSGLPTAREIGRTLDELTARGRAELGTAATIEPSGYIPLYVRVVDHIARTQITSFGMAILIVTIVLMVLLRSIRLGLIALIPNVVPVGMTLAFMGFVGIRLDVATVLIASIVMGLSVNDTSHIFFRFKEELLAAPEAGVEAALQRTLTGTGRAVIAASLILSAGFAVLSFASVKSIAHFGLLCMVSTLFALVADLVITPAVLLTFPIVKRVRTVHV